MNETVRINLDRPGGLFAPGETVEGIIEADSSAAALEAGEVMALWYSEGKGDTDAGITDQQAVQLAAGTSVPFRLKLGELPWSYEGRIVKFRWVIRLRAPQDGKEDLVADAPIEVRPAPSEE